MGSVVVEITEVLDIEQFCELMTKFEQVRLKHINRYYAVDKGKLAIDLKLGDKEVEVKYWQGRFDVLWIENITTE